LIYSWTALGFSSVGCWEKMGMKWKKREKLVLCLLVEKIWIENLSNGKRKYVIVISLVMLVTPRGWLRCGSWDF
jgi:hypothetical protein